MDTVTGIKNPFVGLRAFEEDESYLFFGRNAEINDLLNKFGKSHLLAVIGSSGSGKSSLVKSGLIPKIQGGGLKAGSNWRVAEFRPGDDPIGNIARELAKEGVLNNQSAASTNVPYESIVESTLRRSTTGLIQAYQQAYFTTPETLLIVVDQFEELFRYSKYERQKNSGKSDAMHFVNLLLTATRQVEYPIYVLITMRSDFIGDCAEFRGLPEAINEGQYLVPRMTRDEIREAINGPIAVGKANITQRLVTRLLNDVGNDLDQLPILQHAMMRTWDHWQTAKTPAAPIDIDDYVEIGEMKGALDKHAEIIYAKLTTERQLKICELMFRALTDKAADVRGIRRPTSIEDLCELTIANTEEIISIVEIFRARGCTFLMPPPDVPLTDKSIIDISHESLMRIWKRLIQWTEEEAKSGSVYLELSRDALRYDRKEIGFLWIDPQLANGLKWKEEYKPTSKWAERYNSDFETAMTYLKKSNDKAIADKAEEQERKEADAKRIKDEEDRKRKAKITTASFAVLIFIIIGSIFFLIAFKKQEGIATDKAIEATDSAKAAERQRIMADSLKIIADSNALKASQSAEIQKRLRIIADSFRDKAVDKAKEAHDSTIAAQTQRRIATENEKEALRQKEEARGQNILSAPNEYARLIREGPTEIKKIIKDTFDYKLIAYCNHLKDSLGPLTESLKDKKAMDAYNSLNEKLYNNNDLYDKLYYCLKSKNEDKKVINQIRDVKFSQPKSNFNNTVEAKISEDSLSITLTDNKIIKSLQKIIVLATNKNDQLVIYSTADNFVNVFKYSSSSTEKIPMGTRVTALDYNDEKNIIYFGTANGDIGFITYAASKKNQPVFQNSLYSKITATKFFNAHNKSYLLVTGLRSRPVVYLLDSSDLIDNKNLIGNVYPEKISNAVTDAYFNEADKITLITKSAYDGGIVTYTWNPFSVDLLEDLKKIMKNKSSNYEKTLSTIMAHNKIY